MNDYIKREEAIKAVNHLQEQFQLNANELEFGIMLKDVFRDVIPSADVEPVRHAYDIDEYVSLFECSNCGWTCDDTYGGEPCVGNTVTYNYCPNCGAKIDYKIGYGERKDGESDE